MKTRKEQRAAYKRIMSPGKEGTFTFELIDDVEDLRGMLARFIEMVEINEGRVQLAAEMSVAAAVKLLSEDD